MVKISPQLWHGFWFFVAWSIVVRQGRIYNRHGIAESLSPYTEESPWKIFKFDVQAGSLANTWINLSCFIEGHMYWGIQIY